MSSIEPPDHRLQAGAGRRDHRGVNGHEPYVGLAPAELVGRDGELSVLEDVLFNATLGLGSTVAVEGEPGIGKTALLGAVKEAAAPLFPHILCASADELDRRIPYAALAQLLEPPAGNDERFAELQRLIARSKADENEYAVTERVQALVDDWCAEGPVLLAFDDLQWADAPTVRLLEHLGREAEQLPLLLLGACRTGPAEPEVGRLLRRWHANRSVRIMLEPLNTGAVDGWLGHVLGGVAPGPRLRELVDAASGNPLYLTELLAGLDLDRRLVLATTDGAPTVDLVPGPAAVPATLTDAIRHRLAALTPTTREMLPVGALLASPFSVGELAAVLDRPASDLLPFVQEATRVGVLAVDTGLAFTHPMVRTVLAEDLAPSVRSALHAQIARALADVHAPAVRVAEHLLAAGTEANAMLPWLADAAPTLVQAAPAIAADLLEQGVAAARDSGRPVDPRLVVALADSLLRTGRPAQAEQSARAALATASGPPALRWSLSLACVSQDRTDRALEEIEAALAVGGLTPAEQARFHGLAAQCHITLNQADAAAQAWHQGLAAARASGDTRALAHALQAAAAARAWDGWVLEALGDADACAQATDALGELAGAQLAPQLHRGMLLVELDRDADADAALEAALRAAQVGTGTDFLGWCYQILARLRFVQGRWDESLQAVRAGLDLPDRFDMARHLRALALLIAVHRGDRGAMAELLPAVRAEAPSTSPGNASWAGPTWALALAEEADGRPRAALDLLGPLWCAQQSPDQLRYLRHYLVPDLVAAAMSLGVAEQADQAAADLEAYAAPRRNPSLQRSARCARAIADGDAVALTGLAEEYEAAGRPLFAAQAHEQTARLLAGTDPAAAKRALRAAGDHYESLDAAWDQARVEAQLRALGARRGVRGPRRRPKFGWEALTDTERTVASLVAEGYSNPQIGDRMFLSRRTVQGHVSNILTKLGLSSRVAVATALVRQTEGADDSRPGGEAPS